LADMLRTTNGKYAGRGPKCGTTSRMEGEVMPCTVTVAGPGRQRPETLCRPLVDSGPVCHPL
jgi:hypothetical protein